MFSLLLEVLLGQGLLLGVEIASFFNAFSEFGLYGIIVSAMVIAFVIYKVFLIMLKNNIETYPEFLKKTINTKKKIVINIIDNIINIFLLISFLVMLTGILTFFEQELKINNILFSVFIVLICYFILIKDLDGVIKINTILIPALIFFIIFIGIKFNTQIDTNIELNIKNNITKNWLLSSLIYTSYNSVVLIPILVSLKKEIKNKHQIRVISCVSGIIVGALAIIIYRLLFIAGSHINNVEMPLVFVAGKLGKIYKYIYGIVILSAIFTSAISSGYAFLENTTKTKKQYKVVCFTLCISSIFVSKFGFSSLVNTMYPIFGYLGLLQIIYIFCKR